MALTSEGRVMPAVTTKHSLGSQTCNIEGIFSCYLGASFLTLPAVTYSCFPKLVRSFHKTQTVRWFTYEAACQDLAAVLTCGLCTVYLSLFQRTSGLGALEPSSSAMSSLMAHGAECEGDPSRGPAAVHLPPHSPA